MIDTVAGAKSSMIVYSIAETAKANNLNIYQYLYTLLLYTGLKRSPQA